MGLSRKGLSRSALTIGLLTAALLAGAVQSQDITFAPGTERRNWVRWEPTSVVVDGRHSVRVEDSTLAMKDGTLLEMRLFRPDLEGKTGCVVVGNGYGIRSGPGGREDRNLYQLASRGYVGVHVSLRGSEGAQGQSEMYSTYAADTAAVIEWTAKQPWCNGRVGMIGMSMLGITQWLTAKEAPPALVAIAPWDGCIDCYDQLWYPGGMTLGPARRARPAQEVAAALQHRNFDEWWEKRVVLPADLKRMAERQVAVFMAGGFHDYIAPGQFQAFQGYGVPKGHKQVVIGPWGHETLPPWLSDLQTEFFDYHLRGYTNAAKTRPAASIFIGGIDRWRHEETWPLRDESRVTLRLQPSTASTEQGGKLRRLSPQTDALRQSDVLRYEPQVGPFLTAMLSGSGRLTGDQTGSELRNWAWTSAPVSQAVEITGYPTLALRARALSADADLVLQLSEVDPTGYSRPLTHGFYNLPRQMDRRVPKAWTANMPVALDLGVQPMAHVLRPGHALRVTLSGAATPADGQKSPQGPGPNEQPFALELQLGAEGGTAIQLPIIGEIPPEWR